MKYLLMAFGVAFLGSVWAIMIDCPAFGLITLPCLMITGLLLYLEVRGEFDE